MNVKDRECLLPFETYETEMPNILGNYYNKITCRYAHIIDKMVKNERFIISYDYNLKLYTD